MALETIPFDAARYLDDKVAQTELITDALESGNAAYLKNALNTVARARGMTQVARDAGVNRETLYKALSPTGDPRMSTLLGVFKALGIKLSGNSA